MDNKTKTKSGGAFREFGFAILTFLIMLGAIWGSDWLEREQFVTGDMAFICKEFFTYVARISLVLWTVWIYKSIGFPNTIGPDFKSRFNRGWHEMSDADSAKWMIIVFIGLFIGGAILMLA